MLCLPDKRWHDSTTKGSLCQRLMVMRTQVEIAVPNDRSERDAGTGTCRARLGQAKAFAWQRILGCCWARHALLIALGIAYGKKGRLAFISRSKYARKVVSQSSDAACRLTSQHGGGHQTTCGCAALAGCPKRGETIEPFDCMIL